MQFLLLPFYFGFWFLALEAAVIAPPGNDDLCGGNRAHLITAQICQRSPSFSTLHKYHSCAPTIVLVLQGETSWILLVYLGSRVAE